MKPWASLLFLALAVMPSVAQAPSPDSILIGEFGEIQLFLGMPKDSALGALRENFDVVDEPTGEVAIISKGSVAAGKVGVQYGWVSFKGASLASVTKVWAINGDDKGSVVRAIRGAMSSFGASARACSVKTFYHQEPTTEKSGVEISCGKRHVQILTVRLTSATGSREDVAVNEVLGSEP